MSSAWTCATSPWSGTRSAELSTADAASRKSDRPRWNAGQAASFFALDVNDVSPEQVRWFLDIIMHCTLRAHRATYATGANTDLHPSVAAAAEHLHRRPGVAVTDGEHPAPWRALLRPGGFLIVLLAAGPGTAAIGHRSTVITAARSAGLPNARHASASPIDFNCRHIRS